MEQNVYEYLKSVEAENYHLKQKLKKEKNQTKHYKHLARVFKRKLEEAEKRSNKNRSKKQKGRDYR